MVQKKKKKENYVAVSHGQEYIIQVALKVDYFCGFDLIGTRGNLTYPVYVSWRKPCVCVLPFTLDVFLIYEVKVARRVAEVVREVSLYSSLLTTTRDDTTLQHREYVLLMSCLH